MTYLVCYDVSDNKRRLRVAKYLESVGYRAQNSVFLFEGSERRAGEVRERLAMLTAKDEAARLLVAPLCASCAARVWRSGAPIEEKKPCIVL